MDLYQDLITSMSLTHTVTTIDQVMLAIYDLGGSSDIAKIVNLNLITLTMKAIWNTYVGQMEKWRKQPIPTVRKYTRRKLISSYKTQLQTEIYQLPHHLHSIKLHNFYKDKSIPSTLERDKVVAPAYSYKRKRLSKAETKAFRALWVKTGLVTIDESDGPSPTCKLNLGPIIVMGRPH